MTKNQEILDAVQKLSTELKLHIAETSESQRQTESMYKLFVTGSNGEPTFQERVRNIEKWIIAEKWVGGIAVSIIITDIVVRIWEKIYPL